MVRFEVHDTWIGIQRTNDRKLKANPRNDSRRSWQDPHIKLKTTDIQMMMVFKDFRKKCQSY